MQMQGGMGKFSLIALIISRTMLRNCLVYCISVFFNFKHFLMMPCSKIKGSQIPMTTSNLLEFTGICDPNPRRWYYQITGLVRSLDIIVLFFSLMQVSC